MNSPVEKSFPFIVIDKKSTTSVYVQLMDEIIKAIQLGQLLPGFQFPGTRILANEFQLNRNTIVKSFEELAALGWIDIVPNKGTFVSNQQHHISPQIIRHREPNFPEKSTFQIQTSTLYDQEIIPENYRICLDEGKPDQRLIAYQQANKTYHSVIKRKINTTPKELKNSSEYHIKQVINYLKITRNLTIGLDQIHLVSTREIALQIIAKTIVQPDEYIAVGEMNDPKVNLIFQANQAQLARVKTDENGLVTHHLDEISTLQKIKAVYVSSLHHYPTTATLSQERIEALKAIAKNKEMVIIEENSLFDFYATHRPLIPMAASPNEGNLIYLGDFGNELPSSYQMHYIIGPSDFIAACKKVSESFAPSFDPFVLETISALINEGEITRIIKKHRKIYRERRALIGNLLQQTFKNAIQLKMPKTGLGLWLEWKIPINLMQLKKDALKKGLYIPQVLLYQNKNQIGMRIGFGNLNEDEIAEVVQILKKCYLKQKTQS